MKKQHLRKLERDNESQTEVEKVERGRREIEDILRETDFPLAPEPQWQCSSVGGKGTETRVERQDRRGKEGGVAKQLMPN